MTSEPELYIEPELDLSNPNSHLSLLYANGYKKQWDKLVALESKSTSIFPKESYTGLFSKQREAIAFEFLFNLRRFQNKRINRLRDALWVKPEVVEARRDLFQVHTFCGCEEHKTEDWNSKFFYTIIFGVENKKEDEYILRVDPQTLEIFDMLGNWDADPRPARIAKKGEVISTVHEYYEDQRDTDEKSELSPEWRQAKLPDKNFITRYNEAAEAKTARLRAAADSAAAAVDPA